VYRVGDKVWLKAFEHEPRQRATVMGEETNGTYIVSVGKTMNPPDGFLEVPAEQVEGYQLVPADYRNAVWAQDASNLSGVLYSYAESMHRIRAEQRGERAVDSDSAARHAVSILYLDKLVSLAGGTVRWLEDDETYGKALATCREAAAEDASQSD